MRIPTKKQKKSVESIFVSNNINSQKSYKLSEAFLRPPYQYTIQEINDPGWEEIRQSRFDMSLLLM